MSPSVVGKFKLAILLASINFGLHMAAIPDSAASAASSSTFASEFPMRVLAAHNVARTQAGVAPLTWDPALGNGAAAYAQQMAFTGIFAHSDRKARSGVGENLWMGSRGAFSVENMVGGWVSEREMFAPGFFPAVSRSGNWTDVGHYTQIIWPTTQSVGCAVASNASAEYLVCRYWPAGNIDGRPVPGPTATAALDQR
jgi:hypothetical protein